MDSPNPYQAPLPESRVKRTPNYKAGDRMLLLFFLWAALFAVNMIAPLLFGWSMAEEHGLVGMLIAALMLLVAGWCVCWFARKIAIPMLIGSVFVGLSQLLPALHILIGFTAVDICEALGLVEDPDHVFTFLGFFNSELGGFVATAIVGSGLIVSSLIVGFLIKLVTPKRWWNHDSSDGSENVTSNINMQT